MEPQNNQQPQSPATPQAESGTGPLIGVIIVIIVIIIGGLYFWGQQIEKRVSVESDTEIAGENDPASQNLQTQDSSTEINSIESDLNNTDLDGLDKEINTIDAELTQ